MIDFHSHILPNVDDGSKSIEETVNIVKEAKKAGFDKIISTSHYKEGYFETNVLEKQNLIFEVSNQLKEENIDVELYLGNEIYISNNIVELLKNGQICTINNSNYLLFELPFNTMPLNLYNVIYNLVQHDITPILAHPERYTYVQQNTDILYELIKYGVLFQSNYGSFIGKYGKKAKLIAKHMLKNDMIYFLGSDVHKMNSSYLYINKTISDLEKMIGKEKVFEITTKNPGLVLENKSIKMKNPGKIKLSVLEKFLNK